MKRILHVIRELVANALMNIRAVRKLRLKHPRTVTTDIARQVDVTIQQMSFFFDVLQDRHLKGKVVAEIGPGDAIPLALLFHAFGVARYVAVDRYCSDIAGPHARAIYRGVADALPEYWGAEICQKIREIIDTEEFPTGMIRSGEIILSGAPVEDVSSLGTVDLVVSFNVIEHCMDVPRAFKNMASSLADSGQMIHRIDYSAHDVWRAYENSLEFLSFPDWLWVLMGSGRGYPNRLRHSEIVAAVENAGLVAEYRTSCHIDIRHVLEIRPRLARRFRIFSDDDLATTDAVFLMSKCDHLSSSAPKCLIAKH